MVAALLGVRPAHAQSAAAGWRLRVQRGPGAERCPGEGEFASLVTARMQRPAFTVGATRVVELALRREGRRWSATLVATDEQGATLSSRAIDAEGDECEPLSRSLVLTLALLLDPASVGSAAPVPVPSAPIPSVSSVTPLAPVLPVRAPAAPPRSLRGALWAGGVLDVGLLGRASPGFVLGGELQYHALFVAELAVLPSQGTSDDRVQAGSWSAGFLSGYDWMLPAGFSFALTVGLRAGVLYASGTSTSAVLRGLDLGWLSLGLRPRLRWAWRALFLDLSVLGEVLLLRPVITVDSSSGGAATIAMQPWPATVTPALALGLRFQ